MRQKTPLMMGLALTLFAGVLLVSRVVDLGVLGGADFGASGARGDVRLDVEVVEDHVEISYGRTRYPYLWVVSVDDRGTVHPLVPPVVTSTAPYGRRTANLGERLIVTPPSDRFLLIAMFSPVPRRIEHIQSALDARGGDDPRLAAQEMYLPGRRFVQVIDVELSRRSADAAPRRGTGAGLPPGSGRRAPSLPASK